MICKKKIFSILAVLLAFETVHACDICGCGVGSYYVGILPEFRKKFVGLRYQNKGLMTHLGNDGRRTYLTTDETYHIAELWGAINIGKKFRLLGFIPYNFIIRKNQGVSIRKSGTGDIALMGYYQLLTTRKPASGNKMLVQSLWAGAGMKLPTGRYNPADKNVSESIQNTFQLGTGSLDFMLQAVYDIRLQDAGINTNISYKFNTTNRFEYRYGNKFTMNMLGYYKFKLGKSSSVGPNAGFMFETSEKDIKNNSTLIFDSGGNVFTGTAGFEFSWKKISLGANYQAPFSQQLAEGKVKSRDRVMAHLSFTL